MAWTEVAEVDSLTLQGLDCVYALPCMVEAGAARPKDLGGALGKLGGGRGGGGSLYL